MRVCELCDGLRPEEMWSRTRDRIEANGFTIVMVEAEVPWAYTIGLIGSFDHPEVVVSGSSAEVSYGVLNEVVDRIRTGARFDVPSASVDLEGFDAAVRVGSVHPAHWATGRFAMWLSYYGPSGSCPEPWAVQLVWPPHAFCSEHGCGRQLLFSKAPEPGEQHSGRTGRQPSRGKSKRAKRRRR